MKHLKAITTTQGDWLNESGEPQIIEHHQTTESFLEGNIREGAKPNSIEQEFSDIIRLFESVDVKMFDDNARMKEALVRLHCLKFRVDRNCLEVTYNGAA